jgi:hypothetical protein
VVDGDPPVPGLRATVVEKNQEIRTGPHHDYVPTENVRLRMAKVCVTGVASRSLVRLPHPRMNVKTATLSIGDILWLPLKNLKPWVNTWDKALISVGGVTAR